MFGFKVVREKRKKPDSLPVEEKRKVSFLKRFKRSKNKDEKIKESETLLESELSSGSSRNKEKIENKKTKEGKGLLGLNRVSELIPKRLNEKGYVITQSGILDIFQIMPKNILAANFEEQEQVIYWLTVFYRAYKDDFKIVFMNFPSVTTRQQENIKRVMTRTANEKHLSFLHQKHEELVEIEKSYSDREYYFFLFANNETDYNDKINILQYQLRQVLDVVTLTEKKKEDVLFKLNNQNSRIIIGGDL